MEKVRIGFVGVGNMGQMAHLRNYVTVNDCQVVALADLRPRTAALVARRYGVEHVYADWRQMLDAHELDGVVACQQFSTHFALLPELYPRTRHLFTEKPLAVSAEAGEALAKAAAEAGCVHMVGYHKRSDPAVMAAKETIDAWKASGQMGALKYVRITMPTGDWISSGFVGLLDGGDPRPALPTEPPCEGMDEAACKRYWQFVNYYIHQVNLMRHLLGEPYRVAYADPSGVVLAAESESGAAGVIEMAPYRTTVGWEESALVAFERGYVRIDIPAPLAVNRPGTVEVYRDSGDGATPERTSPTLPWVHAMRQQAIHFVKVCRGEMPPPCEAAEAAEDLRVARDYIRMLADG